MNREDISVKKEIYDGLRDGLPIGLGYFAVAFSLGITAKLAGLVPLQGFLSSFFNHASAGEYALYSMIAAGAAYAETALLIAVTNIRYLLLGAALSQKLPEDTPLSSRLLIGFGITDEIFGIGIARKGILTPVYLTSAYVLACLMWASGTACGIALGNILPPHTVSALSVAIYGMFLAIIIPPAKKDRIVAVLVAVSFVLSYLAAKLPALASVSPGTKTVVLTVLIAGAAALFFPKADEKGGE